MTILVRGARQLLTLRGPIGPRRGAGLSELGLIQDGAVLIRDGLVIEAGPSRRVENLIAARGAEEIDASGRVVMPGFVDSHTHMAWGPSWLEEYEARVAGADSAFLHLPDLKAAFRTAQTSSARLLEARAFATLAAMARHGTTTLEAKTGFGATAAGELKMLRVLSRLHQSPLDVTPTLLAAHWGDPRDANKHLEWMSSQMLPKVQQRKLARFADISCDADLFDVGETRAFLESAGRLGFLLKAHAGQAPHTGGVRLAVEVGTVTVDHLEYACEEDAAALARSSTIATLLPGWAHFLGKPYAPARQLIARGIPVALATDFNPHTSPTCSMQMVISLACSRMGMTPAEAIAAATINGAHALRRADQIGSLETGKVADLLLLNASDYREIPYHFGMNQVYMTIKRGAVVYREGVVQRGAA
jgi:imidazolonepropionase